MASSRSLEGETFIKAEGLSAFARACRRTSVEIAKDLRTDLVESGEVVAREARQIVGQYSESIPPTIKTRVRVATVSVEAGGKTAPRGTGRKLFEAGYGTPESDRAIRQLERAGNASALAYLYEFGDRRNGSGSPTFEHPLFGNKDRMYPQARHPFLKPAADRKMPEVEAKMLMTVNKMAEILAHGD